MLHFDVIVIGTGSMGSAACWFLADRGARVLGLEQFSVVHDNGSHAGQSRIIRRAYFEHPDYVPLLARAYENWRVLEKLTSSEIFHATGLLYAGRGDHENINGVRRSAAQYNIELDDLSNADAKMRYPAFSIPDDFDVILEPGAGFVTPERAIRLYTREAEKRGAVIRSNARVLEWKKTGGVISVRTADHNYTCDKLVVTAGAWSAGLIADLDIPLKVTRQVLGWVDIAGSNVSEKFRLGNFPCWFFEDPERGSYYGFPYLPVGKFDGPVGLKLAHHFPGEPWQADRKSGALPRDAEEDIRYCLAKYLPEVKDAPLSLKTCLYTYSPDAHFIIDHLPGYDGRVSIACGFSGHGFKFASVVGEILADLALTGKTDLPVGFLRLGRFVAKS